jgi:hypothetical protein
MHAGNYKDNGDAALLRMVMAAHVDKQVMMIGSLYMASEYDA